MKRFVLPVIIFLMCAAPASAVNFVEIARNKNNVVYLDLDSSKDKGTYCLAWLKLIPSAEYAKEERIRFNYDADVKYATALYAYNKSMKQSQILQADTHLQNGSVDAFNPVPFNPNNYKDIVPGTLEERIYIAVMNIISDKK